MESVALLHEVMKVLSEFTKKVNLPSNMINVCMDSFQADLDDYIVPNDIAENVLWLSTALKESVENLAVDGLTLVNPECVQIITSEPQWDPESINFDFSLNTDDEAIMEEFFPKKSIAVQTTDDVKPPVAIRNPRNQIAEPVNGKMKELSQATTDSSKNLPTESKPKPLRKQVSLKSVAEAVENLKKKLAKDAEARKSSNMEKLISQRKREKICDQGYVYCKDRDSIANPELSYWRCENRTSCKARAHTRNGVVIHRTGIHTHAPSAAKIRAQRLVAEVRAKALSSRDEPQKIVKSVVSSTDDVTAAHLPSTTSLRRMVQRARNRSANPDANKKRANSSDEKRAAKRTKMECEDEDDEATPITTSFMSQRKREKICDRGFIFSKDKDSLAHDGLSYWRCESRTRSCKARLHLRNGKIVKRFGVHNHTSSSARVEAQRIVSEIREKARLSIDPVQAIVENAMSGADLNTAAYLPAASNLCRMAQRVRYRTRPKGLPAFPKRNKAHPAEDLENEDDSNEDAPAVILGISQRKGEKLSHGGYLYSKEKSSPSSTGVLFWRCDYRNRGCKARVHTKDGKVTKVCGDHNHEASMGKIEAKKILKEIREKARYSMDSTKDIIESALNDADVAAAIHLPVTSSLSRMIQRERNKTGTFPTFPLSLPQMQRSAEE